MIENVDDIKAGQSYRLWYNEGNRNNRIIHVRAIVDGHWYVYRVWSKVRRRWSYFVEPREFFEVSAPRLSLRTNVSRADSPA